MLFTGLLPMSCSVFLYNPESTGQRCTAHYGLGLSTSIINEENALQASLMEAIT